MTSASSDHSTSSAATDRGEELFMSTLPFWTRWWVRSRRFVGRIVGHLRHPGIVTHAESRLNPLDPLSGSPTHRCPLSGNRSRLSPSSAHPEQGRIGLTLVTTCTRVTISRAAETKSPLNGRRCCANSTSSRSLSGRTTFGGSMHSENVLVLEDDLSPAALRKVWSNFATGVAVIAAADGTTPIGFTCQSVVSVSLDPPLLSLCPSKSSTTWPRVRSVGRFCVNILAADQHDACMGFSRTGTDKFVGVEWTPTSNGSPAIRGAMAHLDATITAEHDAGDHTIVVARVTGVTADDGTSPLLFFRGALGGLVG
ncbi:flavin reductase family protein [Gordonia sp. NPDC127522]|uniref:flavin reductase family protein n=1 Tax=Gordonia sp. NPDC127522 TaxID=3345390 RepID=UPI00363AC121